MLRLDWKLDREYGKHIFIFTAALGPYGSAVLFNHFFHDGEPP